MPAYFRQPDITARVRQDDGTYTSTSFKGPDEQVRLSYAATFGSKTQTFLTVVRTADEPIAAWRERVNELSLLCAAANATTDATPHAALLVRIAAID